MSKLHLVQPMGGGGTRFGRNGYECPKPMITLQGKPFFYWSIRSILKDVEVTDIICVVLKEHVEYYHIDDEIHRYFPEAKIKVIDHVLNGAVLTCAEGLTMIEDNIPILVNDCDHAFSCSSFVESIKQGTLTCDAGLLSFNSSNPAYSYVCYDSSNVISGTIEKKVVSHDAICGAYYFNSKETFLEYMDKYLNKCNYEEFFISGLYNEMINERKKVEVFHLDEHISFGTPQELEESYNDLRLKRYL